MKLERETIIDAAFLLLDEVGLDKFTMRGLAARLGVSATALYWHFNDKDELFRAMTRRMYAKAYGALAGKDWQASLIALGRALRTELAACRDSARLFGAAKPAVPDSAAHGRDIARPLVQAGLDQDSALCYEAAVIAFVLGWTVYDQNPSMHNYLSAMFDFAASFDTGLQAMVKGFAVLPPAS